MRFFGWLITPLVLLFVLAGAAPTRAWMACNPYLAAGEEGSCSLPIDPAHDPGVQKLTQPGTVYDFQCGERVLKVECTVPPPADPAPCIIQQPPVEARRIVEHCKLCRDLAHGVGRQLCQWCRTRWTSFRAVE